MLNKIRNFRMTRENKAWLEFCFGMFGIFSFCALFGIGMAWGMAWLIEWATR